MAVAGATTFGSGVRTDNLDLARIKVDRDPKICGGASPDCPPPLPTGAVDGRTRLAGGLEVALCSTTGDRGAGGAVWLRQKLFLLSNGLVLVGGGRSIG